MSELTLDSITGMLLRLTSFGFCIVARMRDIWSGHADVAAALKAEVTTEVKSRHCGITRMVR